MQATGAGLTREQVEAARRQYGGAVRPAPRGRTYWQIVRSNLFTFFNNTLFIIGVALLALGRANDALVSAGLGLLNAFISTVQEMRAKRQLDGMRAAHASSVHAFRDGVQVELAPGEIVPGDLLRLRAGDQVVVDGTIEGAGHLEVDESLLPGGGGCVVKDNGAYLAAGSVVIAGEAQQRVAPVDRHPSTAPRPGREPTAVRTPLQRQVDLVVRAVLLTVALISSAILGQAAMEGLPLVRVVQISAVLSGLVPYGLFLLVTLAYSVGAATIARRGALVQQVNAVESLSNVDVMCVDDSALRGGDPPRYDGVRPHALETLAYLRDRGVAVKLFVRDDSKATAAFLREAGFAPEQRVPRVELDALSPVLLDQVVQQRSVFGPVPGEHKARIVESLSRTGQYVGVIGSGIDDVAALKRAQVGIAMQSGSSAARDAADIVLLRDSFAGLPAAHHEGQRIIGGVATAMKLFLTRVTTAMVIILGVAVLGLGFPYEPAQVSLTLFTVGLPTLFLTAWARRSRPDPHLITDLVRFVVPAAVVTGAFAVAIYAASYTLLTTGLEQEIVPAGAVQKFEDFTSLAATDADFVRTTATAVAQTALSMFTSVTGFLLVLFLKPPHRFFTGWASVEQDKRPALLVISLFVVFVTVLSVNMLADYFGLVQPGGFEAPLVAVASVLWFFVLRTTWRHDLLRRALGLAGAR